MSGISLFESATLAKAFEEHPSLANRTDAPPALGWGQIAPHAEIPLNYRVWVREPAYLEDEKPVKCVGAFRYLTECLDYIAYCQDRGADVWFQSPPECCLVKAIDRRAVCK